MNMRRFKAGKIAGIILLAVAGVFAFGTIVMLLWNALMPEIFHLPQVSFWQALGLLLLTKILFSGFRGPGPKGRMRDKMRQRWMEMTPEEREKFKEDWQGRWGRGRC